MIHESYSGHRYIGLQFGVIYFRIQKNKFVELMIKISQIKFNR